MADHNPDNVKGDIQGNNQRSMRMRAQLKNDSNLGDMTTVKMVINHPMDTGRKKDDFGQLIPPHFIQLISVTLNGQMVFDAQCGTGIAKNPYLTFRLIGAKIGDKLAVKWVDNLGEIGTGEAQVEAA